jgi:hypothetical protein
MNFLLALALGACLRQEGIPVPKQDYEALISGLTKEDRTLDLSAIGFGDLDHHFEPVMKLVDAGFIAIPFLLDHLHDSRPTHALYHPVGFKGLPAPVTQMPLSVGDYCAAILLSYQNDSKAEMLRPAALSGSDQEPALRGWWEKAKRTGEQEYCYQAIRDAVYMPSPVCVRLIQIHYPFVLPAANEALAVKRPSAYLVQILQLICEMNYSQSTKLRMCLRDAQGTDRETVLAAVRDMSKVDTVEFEATLTDLLNKAYTPLAYVPDEGFVGQLASVATLTRNTQVWSALAKASSRASKAGRFEIVTGLRSPDKPGFDSSIELLYSFLGDSSKPNEASQDPREPARLAPVGDQLNNIAAREIGSLLRIEPPDEGASAKQWEIYRKKLATLKPKAVSH